MPGTKVQRQKTTGNRAAIYARVSDKSQDAEDKTSITEQTSEMEAYCERRGLTIDRPLPGGRPGLVQEAPRVPKDAGRRQSGAASTPSSAGSRTASAGACTPPPP